MSFVCQKNSFASAHVQLLLRLLTAKYSNNHHTFVRIDEICQEYLMGKISPKYNKYDSVMPTQADDRHKNWRKFKLSSMDTFK